MKRLVIPALILVILASTAFSNGVTIIDGENEVYLTLVWSKVDVSVENQVAVITTTQAFRNDYSASHKVKYAFPLPEEASATGLQWRIEGQWYEANIAPTPQDTTAPGETGETHPNLKSYLGETPMFFEIEQIVKPDSLLEVKLSYVELLPYEFGDVHSYFPNDYGLIQSEPVELQQLDFTLTSARTIDSIQIVSHEATSISNDGQIASVQTILYDSVPDEDYHVQYTLSLEELGLFGLSTFLPDSVVPDSYGTGFFVYVAEPDPGEGAEIISKVFTLIVDRSGSMTGDKIDQARDAASFIVEQLNELDYFNIVDFSSLVSSFESSHVPLNRDNEQAALDYIAGLQAAGSTNISGAFEVAIPQFGATTDTTANIIIFFTDGEATAGIEDTDELLQFVQSLVQQNETTLKIFTFGIGTKVNERLLTLLATENGGVSEFLGGAELEDRITEFYLQIRNPVLLNTQMSFSPQVIEEAYPSPLPSLYQGQQMIVAGRYLEPTDVSIMLNGEAFGQPVEYQYELALTDSAVEKNRFLTKVWAKKKIEHLLLEYYSLDENSEEASAIKEEIIEISFNYGVISPFTSYTGGHEIAVEEETGRWEISPTTFRLLGNFPNPFNLGTTIRFEVAVDLAQVVTVKIYNSLGQLVRILAITVNGKGIYEVYWDGHLADGSVAPAGTYIFTMDVGLGILGGKMTLLK